MLEFIANAVSWLLVMFFAAVWGAHLFGATVIFPVHVSGAPQSLVEWVASPYAMRVYGFWRRLVPGLYTVATIAVIVAVIMGLRTRPAMAVAGVCGLMHMTMVLLVFVPINLKLGLDPGGPGASSLDPQTVKTLIRRWGRWNLVRIGVETTGLIAALLAFKAS